jgi:putative FmdB family regulatory protein
MPTYEYACEKCGLEFEREQRITDEPVKTCPRCRARKVRRLISRTAFVLKGGGWYSDLYASPKPETQRSAADKEASAPAAKEAAPSSAAGGEKSPDAGPGSSSKSDSPSDSGSKRDSKGSGKSKGGKGAKAAA